MHGKHGCEKLKRCRSRKRRKRVKLIIAAAVMMLALFMSFYFFRVKQLIGERCCDFYSEVMRSACFKAYEGLADDAALNKILYKVPNGQGDLVVLVDTALLNALSFNFSSAVKDAFDERALKGVAIGCGVFSALRTFSLCGNKFTVYPKCYCVADCAAVWRSQVLGERCLNTLCLDIVCTVYSYGVFAAEPVVYAVSFPVVQYFSM